MPKKKKKKSWKERQRERQIKQQRVREAYQIQRERKRKPRQWPKGKIVGAVCLLALIFGAYGVWQYTKPTAIIEPPSTEEVIYIRAGGQLDPSTASILNVGNIYYTFTADIHGSIVIERDNIVVDGSSHTLQGIDGSDAKGIRLPGRSNVTIKNLKIKDFDYGVYLYSTTHNILSQNNLTNNNSGIYLIYSSYNTLSRNGITNSTNDGICLDSTSHNILSQNNLTNNNSGIYFKYSSYNNLSGNHITDNTYGIYLDESSYNNNYHNNFIDNYFQVYGARESTNDWDDGHPSGGNYWSDYNGTDLDQDGIGDTAYDIIVDNADSYPLMGMFHSFNVSLEHSVQTICNSTISGFQFNSTAISFNVAGEDDTTGLCRICIPTALMIDNYKVFVNGTEVPYTLLPFSNSTNSYLYFTYNHSTHEVVIIL